MQNIKQTSQKKTPKTTLHLYKQNFKFSSAHFLIFDDQHAEKLHGHNYQVKVDVAVPADFEMDETGFYFDFNVFKKEIKAACDEWDEHVLLPALHKDMKITEDGDVYLVRFRERRYMFPRNEVHLLPVTNTSVEQLARILGEKLLGLFKEQGVQRLRVSVEETRGQSASVVLTV